MAAKYETAILQNEIEFARFVEILKRENVRSYLEIGSKFGGSLWRAAIALPKRSRVVSVDLPQGDRSFKATQTHLEACVDELWKRGYEARLILGDSTDRSVVHLVSLLGPFDAVFIDGGHTLACVTSDWKNYGAMARVIGFHDIGWRRPERTAPSKKDPIDVPRFWDSIKGEYRHQEIKLEPFNNGIGVLWR